MLIRIILLTVIWLTACTPIRAQSHETQPPPIEQPVFSSPVETSVPQLQPTFEEISSLVSREMIEKARQDLAQRLAVPVEEVTVVTVIGMEFSTDAFSCQTSKERIAKDESPQVVSGVSIVLSTSGRKYEYHASDQIVIFCQPLH